MPAASPFAVAADLFDPQPDQYLHNPAGWVTDRTGEHLWSRQVDIMDAVRDHRRTVVKACHGPGKSFSGARLAGWWIDAHPPGQAVVVSSAPTWQQVRAILWRELRTVHRLAGLPGNITLDCNWTLDDGSLVAFGRKPADHDQHGFQGIHARYILVILDEGCGIPTQLFRAASTLLTNEDARIVAFGNPDDPQAEFATICEGAADDHDSMSAKGWWVMTIPAASTPNFTGEAIPEDLRQRLVTPMWVDEFALDVGGVESPLYVSKVLARFPTDASDGAVPWTWIRQCIDPEWAATFAPLREPVELGVDVGGSDTGDETVIYERLGPHVGRRWAIRSSDPENILLLCEQAIREAGPSSVKIDSIGIGWGILAGIRRTFPDLQVVGVNVAEAAADPRKFANKRAEIWWEVGRSLSKDRGWNLTDVDHASTQAELAAPKWREDKSGRIVIESKVDIHKRIGRSTDNADALLLAFYKPNSLQAARSSYRTTGLKGRR